MKKSAILFGAVFLLSSASFAQSAMSESRQEQRKLERSEVTYQGQQQFLEDYKNVTVLSKDRFDNIDQFTFKNKEGKIITAYYDADANLIGTTEQETYNDIPETARKDIQKWYPGYVPTDAIFYNDNEENDNNLTLYGLDPGDEDAYFVELRNNNNKIVLQISKLGEVTYYTRLL